MHLLDALQSRGHPLGDALRITRHLVIERLMVLDCSADVPVRDVTACMTALAEIALDCACAAARQSLDVAHGPPCSSTGGPARLWVLGMGKLGSRELNVSSDIDLIYVYDEDGDTTGDSAGRGRIGNQEYFAKCARAIHALIGETTEHGLVFRIDLALRPNGNSGPVAISLGALEEYFQVQGREWERFAWLKSRLVAPAACTADGSVTLLRQVVVPFVFRRYLDYSVFDALRVLHAQIRDHATKRSAGRPERANDVKLSRGGIREIEFTVQLLQVVRGGQFHELRTRSTQNALQRLAAAGLMPAQSAQALSAAYEFLRRVEHRIQYLDDQQTHVLPTDDADLAWIASTLGLASTSQFLEALDGHRERVAQEFDILLGGSPAPCKTGSCGQGESAADDVDALFARLPPALQERLTQLRAHPRVQNLRDESRARLMRLMTRTAQWLLDGQVTELAVQRLADWIEPLLRRESYLALLIERPNVHERLTRILGAARWPARYLIQHPGVIDELASSDMLEQRFNAAEFETELERRKTAVDNSGESASNGADETLLNLLRRAHHAEVFRTLARDVEGRLTVEQVADDLSALAECVLKVTTRWCWERLRLRHRSEPRMAIIAYGKLGGKELGYGSDLDIVFVYDDDDERSGDIYAALARKLITWLTVKTAEGDLYEIDTALRPNGNAGLLVSSFEAFTSYQQQRGSNTAWTWEHQAMTRARCVLAEPALRQRFEAIRHAVLTAPRDAAGLALEIVAMRQRVGAAHPVRAGQFDVKHSPGGMVDVEFAVQHLVLAESARHAGLADNVGNIALLERAEACGLLPPGVGHAAADAYRVLRRIQHVARLDEAPTQVDVSTVQTERHAVSALWQHVFGLQELQGDADTAKPA